MHSVHALIREVEQAFAQQPEVALTFARCLPNSLETALQPGPGGTFVITGDIPAMWLRDAAAQVWPYLPLCAGDPPLRELLAGVIRQQARQLLTDPYANAFNAAPSGAGHAGDQPPRHPLVWERKFELDSLCYPIRLAHGYWRHTGDLEPLRGDFLSALRVILEVMHTEQRHDERSAYRFWRPGEVPATDNLPAGGRGHPTAPCGLIWSAFRPSDDACELNYHVPGNMMAAVELAHAAELAGRLDDPELAAVCRALGHEIRAAIEEHAVVSHPDFGRLYAYETDGRGHHVLMDDANVPSLLSAPYLGYLSADDPTYRATRRFVLSPANPYFARGAFAQGVGSPHTPAGHVWPIGLAMAGLTATDAAERRAALDMLVSTTAGTRLMHESFHPDDPATFTREWFGWANGLFAELVLAVLAPEPRAVPGS
ncbi:glycoside hydrolase family 125 protein [Deinococcus koreensis]|uniref:Metal-independent alpha-mannosidase n=1 Tax=Deinococcus koreensis TaxID=2054903 RepID=A0A2K3UYQ3_9DEIO|nr:glycoside hydrolase family 125 protein [Deinococcus koreensis]PNY81663.1 metal-independent alpha-mannosidase [Deinococcus koreensis]